MKLLEAEIRKWAQQISDDYMHYSAEDFEYVVKLSMFLDAELLPNDAGIIGYNIIKDFDCKKKMSVVLLYCKPEYRGRYLGYMFRRIEEIAKQEGAVKIFIGDSDSGYKEEKFNRVLSYFGYCLGGHVKEV